MLSWQRDRFDSDPSRYSFSIIYVHELNHIWRIKNIELTMSGIDVSFEIW